MTRKTTDTHVHVEPADGEPEPPLGTPPGDQEPTMVRAATGKGRAAGADRTDDRGADDLPPGVAHDPDPSRDLKVAGTAEPHDSTANEMARARAATAAGRAPGTINDPNSVTTGTDVEPNT